MIIRFSVELPFALKKECEKKLKEYIKNEVSKAIQAYGVFEVVATARPKGAPRPREEEEELGEEKKFWFEEALESE
jgi:hypothetical protein